MPARWPVRLRHGVCLGSLLIGLLTPLNGVHAHGGRVGGIPPSSEPKPPPLHRKLAQGAMPLDCSLAGLWRASNGDSLQLGGLSRERGSGTLQFRSGVKPNFSISGIYRVTGDELAFQGADSRGREQDIVARMVKRDGKYLVTAGVLDAAIRPQVWTRIAADC